jgi:hypothetical protein
MNNTRTGSPTMNTKRLSLVLFLTLVAGVATAAIQHRGSDSARAAAPQEAVGEIPRIVITASRPQADADVCDNPVPRVVVVGRRTDLKVAAK